MQAGWRAGGGSRGGRLGRTAPEGVRPLAPPDRDLSRQRGPLDQNEIRVLLAPRRLSSRRARGGHLLGSSWGHLTRGRPWPRLTPSPSDPPGAQAPPSLARASPAPRRGQASSSAARSDSPAFALPRAVDRERSRPPGIGLRVEVGLTVGGFTAPASKKPELHIPGDLCSFPTSSSGSPERGSRARAARTPAEQHAYTCPISSNQIHTTRRLHTHACSPPAAFSRPAVPRGPARRSPTPTIRPAAPQHTRAAPRGAHLLDLGGAFPPLA